MLVVAPLPLGLNRPLSWTVAIAILGLLGLAWPLIRQRSVMPPTLPLAPLSPALILFAGVLLWVAAQGWPGLPAQWTHPHWAHPLWAVARDHGVPGVDAVSVAPYATGTGLLRLTGYALAFWLVLNHALSRRRAERLLDILAAAGGLYALYALLVHLSGSETILWYRKWAYEGYLTGTFVNRNSYAAFAGLSLLCALAAVARRLDGERLRPAVLVRHLTRRTALFALAAVLIAVSQLASDSRAGIMATLCGLVVFAAALAATRGGRARPGAVAGTAALCLLFIAVWGATVSLSETMVELGSDRLQVYGLALGALAERPWLGHGLGAFPHLMQELRTPAQNTVWTEVHNSYIELALELGLPAAAALLAALVWPTLRVVIGLVRRRDARVFCALALAGTVQIALHSTLDFVAQIPAVTLLWMALLGLGVGRAEVRRSRWAQENGGVARESSLSQAALP